MKRKMDEEEDVTITTQQQPPGIAPGGDSFPRLQNRALAPAPVCEPRPENMDPSASIQSYSIPTTYQVPPIGQGTLGQSASGHDTHLHGSRLSSPRPRSLTHPNSAHSQAQAQGEWQQIQFWDINDALFDLLKVKERFGNQSHVHSDFLDIIKEYKSQIIDTQDVIDRVSNLFQGHPDLIRDFIPFLPHDCKIEVQKNDLISVPTPTQAEGPMEHTALKMQNCDGNMHRMQLLPTQPSAMSNKSLPSSPHPSGQSPSLPGFPTQHPVPSNTSHTSHTTQLLPTQPSAMPNKPVPSSPQPPSLPGFPTQHPVPSNTSHTSHTTQLLPTQPSAMPSKPFPSSPQPPSLPGFPTQHSVQTDTSHTSHITQLWPMEPSAMSNKSLPSSPHPSGQPPSLPGFPTQHPVPSKTSHTSHTTHRNTPPSIKAAICDVARRIRERFQNQPEMHNAFRAICATYEQCEVKAAQSKNAPPPSQQKASAEIAQLLKNHEDLLADLRKLFPNLMGSHLMGKTCEKRDSVHNDHGETVNQPLMGSSTNSCSHSNSKRLMQKEGPIPCTSGTGSTPPMKKKLKPGGFKDSSGTDSNKYGNLGDHTFQKPKCSGRTALCHEFVNDTLGSCAENLKFLSSKYRCDDERFELDDVLQTNMATIAVLEGIQKKISHMSEEDKSHFHLDSFLGGSSEVVHLKALHWLYGDNASYIIDGLKRNPVVVVPNVLKRLKNKDKEWRKAQCAFNQVWHEQNEKYHLKSLDHQAIDFKRTDTEALCSKNLLNEIETIFNEHQEQVAEGNPPPPGPHLSFEYENEQVLEDAASLIIHQVKRQSGLQAQDKRKIKQILHHLLPDLFFMSWGELSDVEEGSGNGEEEAEEIEISRRKTDGRANRGPGKKRFENRPPENKLMFPTTQKLEGKDLVYNLFFVNNNWYILLRLHQILCQRLLHMYQQAERQIDEERREHERDTELLGPGREREDSPASLLRPKQSKHDVEDYYPAFLGMVRNLLDGNMESSVFEDKLREMFTIHAYTCFTIDNLIQSIVRQLQHIVTDEVCVHIMEMYLSESSLTMGGRLAAQSFRSPAVSTYRRRSRRLLADENCFMVVFSQNAGRLKLTMELLGIEEEHLRTSSTSVG